MFSISTLFLLKIYSGKSELGLYDISFKNLQVIEQYQSQKGLFLVFAMIDRICSKRLICLKFARGFGVIGGAQITLTPRTIDILYFNFYSMPFAAPERCYFTSRNALR